MKKTLKNAPIKIHYGLIKKVCERTNYSRAIVERALGGYTDSLIAHNARKVANEIIMELQIKDK